jgi:hypothetical protein
MNANNNRKYVSIAICTARAFGKFRATSVLFSYRNFVLLLTFGLQDTNTMTFLCLRVSVFSILSHTRG